MTAIPIVETQEGDVSAYIRTNVISITDSLSFGGLQSLVEFRVAKCVVPYLRIQAVYPSG